MLGVCVVLHSVDIVVDDAQAAAVVASVASEQEVVGGHGQANGYAVAVATETTDDQEGEKDSPM